MDDHRAKKDENLILLDLGIVLCRELFMSDFLSSVEVIQCTLQNS